MKTKVMYLVHGWPHGAYRKHGRKECVSCGHLGGGRKVVGSLLVGLIAAARAPPVDRERSLFLCVRRLDSLHT